MNNDNNPLLQHLPAVYHEDIAAGNTFLQDLLRVLQALMIDGTTLARELNTPIQGLGSIIDQLAHLFVPQHQDPSKQTPPDYLPWLASWVAIALREDWSEVTQRKMIREVVSLYPMRGTRYGLERMLNIYIQSTVHDTRDEEDGRTSGVTIKDQLSGMLISDTVENGITVGRNSVVEGLPPHFFLVNVAFSEPDPVKIKEKTAAVIDILEREKPAHTYYKVITKGPTLQVGVPGRAEVGDTTLI